MPFSEQTPFSDIVPYRPHNMLFFVSFGGFAWAALHIIMFNVCLYLCYGTTCVYSKLKVCVYEYTFGTNKNA